MFMVYTMLGGVFFLLSWAMTNLPLGLLATVAIPVVAVKSNAYNGFLVGTIIAGFCWGNLPLGDGDSHAHEAGHAPAADNFWDPWGIAYRLVATSVCLAFLTGVTLAISDKTDVILWMDRAQLANIAITIIKLGAGCMALLTAYVVATNYSSAQAQG